LWGTSGERLFFYHEGQEGHEAMIRRRWLFVSPFMFFVLFMVVILVGNAEKVSTMKDRKRISLGFPPFMSFVLFMVSLSGESGCRMFLP